MTDRTEAQIESLRGEIGTLTTELAGLKVLLSTTAETVKEERRKAQEDRNSIWIEVRGLGNKQIDAVNELKALRRDVSEMAPTVRVLEHERLQVLGAGKAAIFIGRAMWLAGGALVGAAVAVLTWAGFIKPH